MKRILAVLAVAALPVSASAADVNGGDPFYSQSNHDAPMRVNWTGLYVGGAIGYGHGNHDLSVRDYFKDYCWRDDLPNADDPFGPQRIATLENINKNPNFDFSSCSEVEIPQGQPLETVSGDSREVASLNGLSSTGLVGDVRLGYDHQFGRRFVLGVFGTYGFSDMETDGAINGVGGFTLERGDDWSVGVRAGALVNERTLLYILAAYTETEYELNVAGGGFAYNETTDFHGVTVGAGLEFALTQNVFLGLEGTHTFYDDETIFDIYDPASNQGLAIKDDLGETKVMATIKVKFGTQDLLQ